MRKKTWACVLLGICTLLIANSSSIDPTNATAYAGTNSLLKQGDRMYAILHFFGQAKDTDLVAIEVGSKDGLVEESVLKSYRASPVNSKTGEASGQVWIETGTLKAVQVEETYSIAKIVVQGSAASRAVFTKFPGVMAGDMAKIPDVKVEPRQMIAPTISFDYRELFDDPKALPYTYELSENGIKRLREAAEEFAHMRLSLLLIEGYTDANGPAEQNQIESYQRAATVRQFFINDLGFDEERTVGVGFGENAVSQDTQVPEYNAKERRVVIKAMASQE